MRFLNVNGIWNPMDGAIVPFIVEKGAEVAKETAVDYVHVVAQWLVTNGVPIATEILLLWGLACFLIACSGSGKWLERGAKSIIFSTILAVIGHAV
jgi:hypothetical protein